MAYWYDYRLVALSIVMAVIASYISLAVATRIKAHRDQVSLWLTGGALAMGIGIWSMHFIGMLAYHMPIPLGYDIPLTLFSLLLAIIAAMIALYVIVSSEQLDWTKNALSALMMGGGIAGMHYTGIYAMQMAPPIAFDTTMFVASLLIAYVASFFAIRFAFVYSQSESFLDKKMGAAAVIMGIAIAGMHYTAMEAQNVAPDAICMAADYGLSNEVLTALVIAVVMVILVITGLVLNSDLKLAQKERLFAMQMAEGHKRSLAEAGRLAAELSRESLRNEEFANQLVDTLGTVVAVLNQRGVVVRFNRSAERVTGFKREEVIDKPVWETLIPKEQRLKVQAEFQSMDPVRYPYQSTGFWQTRDGALRLIDWSNTALYGENGEVEFVIATGIDVTEQRRNENELKIAAVAFNTNEAILVTDAKGNILRANRVFTEITGYEEAEVIGQNTSLLKSGRHDAEFYRNMWSKLNAHGYWVGEIWNRRKDGELYPEWLRISVVTDEQGRVTNYVGSFSDISQLKQAEEQLTYLSNYDQSTGLPNRQLFSELLHREITLSRPTQERGLLLYMRFIQFGLLNESLGIATVDRFIERFIAKLRELTSETAIIGRASGSSFLLALPRVEPAQELSTSGSMLAESIIRYAGDGEVIEGAMVRAGVNIGIATFPQESMSAQEVMQNAFVALERAKQIEGASYNFFSEALHQAAVDAYNMEIALRAAINNGELMLYYQPQVNREGVITCCEGLLRWRHNGEFVEPEAFIALAERSELIHEIGNFVFREGIGELARLIDAGLPPEFGCLSLNMSAKQFCDEKFIDNLKKYLIEFSVSPEYIKIELTETALVAEPRQAIATINSLKELGISISLDDFGTGYSSLSYLHRIPIDQLKIDQSFVRDITINRVSRSITETIIRMAESMEIDVIAEGVETKDEKELLDSFGCSHYQGFYFYKPMPADEFVALLGKRQAGQVQGV